MKEDVFKKSVAYIQRKIRYTLDQVSEDKINKLCNLFLKADRIFVYGAGRSGLTAKAFAIRLVHLGFQTFVIGETITPPVRKGDLVFVVSNSGETMPSVMTADIAKNLGAEVISVVGNQKSTLSKRSDISLILSTECNDKERAKFAPLGTLFEATVWVFLDGIVSKLLHEKGENEENMKKRHATLQ